MTNFTPGPWKAQQDCRSEKNNGIFTGENPDQYGNQNMWGIYGPHFRIAEVYEANQFEGLTQETVDANARLISSAPYLLEMLIVFLDHAQEPYPSFKSERGQMEIQQVRKLLAYIRGE